MPDTFFLVSVTYTVNSKADPQMFTGQFAAASSILAREAGKDFVLRYIKPTSILDAVIVTPT